MAVQIDPVALDRVRREREATARQLGHAFHATLEAYLGHPNHPEDATHDLAVGSAILAFAQGTDPQTIVRDYNRWATEHQYALIRYVGPAGVGYPPGTHLVDIQTAILAIGPDGSFAVVQPPTAPQGQGLRARLLPPEEWDAKLVGTALEANRPDPRYAFIVVVEDGDQVVACWSAISTVHLERLWVTAEARGTAGVARRLLTTMVRTLQLQGVTEVLTNAETPEVAELLTKVGAHALPGQTWVLPIPEKEG